MANKTLRTRIAASVGLLIAVLAGTKLAISYGCKSALHVPFSAIIGLAIGGGIGAGGDKAILKKAFPQDFFIILVPALIWVVGAVLLKQTGTVITVGGAVVSCIAALWTSRRR
jgi:hypothetical protein